MINCPLHKCRSDVQGIAEIYAGILIGAGYRKYKKQATYQSIRQPCVP